jgi:hypothetical protein
MRNGFERDWPVEVEGKLRMKSGTWEFHLNDGVYRLDLAV